MNSLIRIAAAPSVGLRLREFRLLLPTVVTTTTLLGLLTWETAHAAVGDVIHQPDMLDPLEQSTPALGRDGTLYVADTEGFVDAYNPQTRHTSFKYLSGSIVSAPVLADDGTVFVGTTATQTDNFFALDPQSLEIRQRFKATGAIRGSATIGRDRTVYIGTDQGHVYALHPETLREKWTRELRRFDDGTGVKLPVEAGMALGQDGTLYVPTAVGDNSALVALDAKTGRIQWRYLNVATINEAPAIGPDGMICYVDRNGFVVALRPDGQRLWETLLDWNATLTSPVIGAQGDIYVGSSTKQLYCLSRDGATRWSFSTSGSRVAGAPAVGANGLLYIGAVKQFFCIRASDGGLVWQRTLDKGTRDIGNVILSHDKLAWFCGGKILFGVQVEAGLARTAFWPSFRGSPLHQGKTPARDLQPVLGQPYCSLDGKWAMPLFVQPGVTCLIEQSSDLVNWTFRSTHESCNGVITVALPEASDSARSFYRGRQ